MARVSTGSLDLGMWLDGENPGAGSQVSFPNSGLNGNAMKVQVAVGTQHNADGTHKDNVIDKNNLKTTVCDGASIEKDSSVGLRVKALGILSGMLAAGAVIAGKIADGAVDTTGRLVDRIVTGAKIALATILTENIADAQITAVKESHDNNSRKQMLWFAGNIGTNYEGVWLGFCGVPQPDIADSPVQVLVGRAFCVTGCTVKGLGSTHSAIHYSYSTSGVRHYTATDYIGFMPSPSPGNPYLMKNGTTTLQVEFAENGTWLPGSSEVAVVGVEIEFDD